MSHRGLRRAATYVAALLLVLTVVLAQPASALLREQAAATGTEAVSSATWAAIPTQSTTPSPSALTLTFPIALLGSPAAQYFDVVNTGTRTLDGAAYFVALSGFSLLDTPTLTLEACAVGVSWNTTTGACTSGTATFIGSFNGSSSLYLQSTAAPTTAGTRLHLQASVSKVLLSGTLTAVISAEVTSQSPQDIVPVTTSH